MQNLPRTGEIHLAENIALLSLLQEVPALPSRNEITPSLEIAGRELSLNRERGLAGALSFLSGISNDGKYVTAVCIEEIPDSDSLRVILAINKSTVTDGTGVLKEVKLAFENIFRILSEAQSIFKPSTI